MRYPTEHSATPVPSECPHTTIRSAGNPGSRERVSGIRVQMEPSFRRTSGRPLIAPIQSASSPVPSATSRRSRSTLHDKVFAIGRWYHDLLRLGQAGGGCRGMRGELRKYQLAFCSAYSPKHRMAYPTSATTPVHLSTFSVACLEERPFYEDPAVEGEIGSWFRAVTQSARSLGLCGSIPCFRLRARARQCR